MEENETRREKLDEMWDAIGPQSVKYLDRSFDVLAPKLLTFLMISILNEEQLEIGTFGSEGSIISYDIYNTDKQLNLRLQHDEVYKLELILCDFDCERKMYEYILDAEEETIVPVGLRNLMREVRDTNESRTVVINSLKN